MAKGSAQALFENQNIMINVDDRLTTRVTQGSLLKVSRYMRESRLNNVYIILRCVLGPNREAVRFSELSYNQP
jgi:hypothetical protein